VGVACVAADVLLVALARRLGGAGLTPLVALLHLVVLGGAFAFLWRSARRAERSRAELRRELEAQAGQLAQARHDAQSANRARSAFLANVSHELRTPLNAILGYSELMRDEARDSGRVDLIPDLKRIHSSGRQLLALVNDVLEITRLEAGLVAVRPQSFPLANLVQEVSEEARPLAEAQRNRLTVVCPPGIGTVRLDPDRLRQILLNLLGNAGQFTEDGEVRLEVERMARPAGDWLTFRIADTGQGMSPEQVEHLFEEFAQGDPSTTRKHGGIGLGLALSRRCARLMGGELEGESAGRGSTFTLRLPAEYTAAPLPFNAEAAEGTQRPQRTDD